MNTVYWGPIRRVLEKFRSSQIENILGCAGVDRLELSSHIDRIFGSNQPSKSKLIDAAQDVHIKALNQSDLERFAVRCCEEMLRLGNDDIKDELDRLLNRLEWQFIDGNLVPIDVFDSAELSQIPDASGDDIIKAAVRLRNGDLSGALSACCGALDSATAEIYSAHDLGNHKDHSFQRRIKKSMGLVGVETKLNADLEGMGWEKKDIDDLSNNLIGSLNQAAYVMQKLRSDMGDVHGTKPVLSALVYDSIKWSLILLRMLNEES